MLWATLEKVVEHSRICPKKCETKKEPMQKCGVTNEMVPRTNGGTTMRTTVEPNAVSWNVKRIGSTKGMFKNGGGTSPSDVPISVIFSSRLVPHFGLEQKIMKNVVPFM